VDTGEPGPTGEPVPEPDPVDAADELELIDSMELDNLATLPLLNAVRCRSFAPPLVLVLLLMLPSVLPVSLLA
jgi:hypothetical protein